MTIEEIQKLAELTETARINNDIVVLKKIYQIIQQDEINGQIGDLEGNEWFFSRINSEQLNSILS